jgi:hypothetical protein
MYCDVFKGTLELLKILYQGKKIYKWIERIIFTIQ